MNKEAPKTEQPQNGIHQSKAHHSTPIQSNIESSFCSQAETQEDTNKFMPSIPSPSRYGAIEALDIGDEERELERWADRTETITRMEHET